MAPAFRKVVDEVTDGCGCACHTGIGYKTACSHCLPYAGRLRLHYRLVTCRIKGQEPLHAWIEWEGEEPPIPGDLVARIYYREFDRWLTPLARVTHES